MSIQINYGMSKGSEFNLSAVLVLRRSLLLLLYLWKSWLPDVHLDLEKVSRDTLIPERLVYWELSP